MINLIQYLAAIAFNQNADKLKNTAIKTDMVLVILTIAIPVLLLGLDVPLNASIVPMFILLYVGFRLLNHNVHRIYLHNEESIEQVENQSEVKSRGRVIQYVLILAITGVLLFIVGEFLGNALESLCQRFYISENIIGILLGFITSIPELITFFESQKHYRKAEKDMSGVVEATNNLLTSNTLNLFVIQTIGILMLKT